MNNSLYYHLPIAIHPEPQKPTVEREINITANSVEEAIKHTKDLSETVGSDVINDLNGINYPARLILTAGDQFSIFENVFLNNYRDF